MRLQLVDTEIKVAEENMNDDALEMWYYCTLDNNYKIAPTAFYARKHILKGQGYFEFTIVDDNGECSVLNCSKKMHKAMFEFQLYPPIIQNIFN
jgi:hypothetical protein